MEISTSLKYGIKIAGCDARESARMMKTAGFDGIDLGLIENMREPEKILLPEWRDRVLATALAAKAEGLQIAQTHLPYYPATAAHPGSGTYEEFEAYLLPAILRALEVTSETGAPVAVMHPYYLCDNKQKTFDGNYRLIEKMMPVLEKNHTRLALENVWGINYSNTNMSCPEDILQVIEHINDPHIGACIDTGHANIFRIDVTEMARMYGKHLFALHVNGNGGHDDGHVLPYCLSDWCERIDYRAFASALREIGFSGFFNLELAVGPMPSVLAQPFYTFAAAVARALADLAE